MTGLPAEFDLIHRHFRPLAGPGALDLSDDAALLHPPPGRTLVLCADAMVAGVHFLPDDPPDTIARKLLRTNLSDLAAMGAAPLSYLLTISLPPNLPPDWIAGFCSGLRDDGERFGIALLGGDTTSTPGPLSLSLTAIGSVVPGRVLRRAGARPGHGVWVSGTIGDAALGLLAAREKLPDPDGFLLSRYRLPEPRLALGAAAVGLAAAAIDVSDGLVQDLEHLCRAGGCGAMIEAAAIPTSAAAAAIRSNGPNDPVLPRQLGGGDDYELLFAVPPGDEPAFARLAAVTPVRRIGGFVSGHGVTVLGPDGRPVIVDRRGWSHL